MKRSAVIAFFTIFFSIYALINIYVYLTGWAALRGLPMLRWAYFAAFFFLASTFVVGRILERRWSSVVSSAFLWTGSLWLGAMLYFFLACVAIDVIRLLALVIAPLGDWIARGGSVLSREILAGAIGLVGVILGAGHWNARHPRVRRLTITLAKPLPEAGLTIAAASDLHLGTIIGPKRCEAIVDSLNAQGADLILLPGDLVDEDLGPVIRGNLGEKLRGLKARFGVYAVTGNHEYIGGVEPAVRYLREHGIKVLRDEVVELPCGVTLVGREDRSSNMSGIKRKSFDQLLNGTDRARPLIVMDHQPFHLDEAVRAGVDLQLSGHTHHGQLWPFNLITRAIYEVSWGYLRKGGTQFYVSCGVGTWGPPVRTGNRPEILRIELHSDQQSLPRR